MFFTGKWHVSVESSPSDHGWEEGTVTGRRGDFHGTPWPRYERLAASPDAASRGEGEILRPGYGTARLYGERPADAPPGADETALREALERLPALAAGRDPWCLFVGFIAPHDPYFAPRACLDRVPAASVALPPSFADRLADKPRVYRRMREQVFGQLTEREVREGIRHFRACCCEIDDRFGRLLAALDASGAARDTLVLFCSDHGDYCGEHGLFAKGIPCFQGAYRVPFVVRWPAGLAAPGRRCDAFVSLADFAPTALELAGLRADRRLSGRSLVPFLRGETPDG